MSLKTELNQIIKERTYVPYEEIVRYCMEYGAKISQAERRLRKSDSPNVVPEMAKSRRNTDYIKGYWWKEVGHRVPVVGVVADKKVIYREGFLKTRAKEEAKLI